MSIKLLFQSCIKQEHKSDYIDISGLKIYFDMTSLPIFNLQHFQNFWSFIGTVYLLSFFESWTWKRQLMEVFASYSIYLNCWYSKPPTGLVAAWVARTHSGHGLAWEGTTLQLVATQDKTSLESNFYGAECYHHGNKKCLELILIWFRYSIIFLYFKSIQWGVFTCYPRSSNSKLFRPLNNNTRVEKKKKLHN